MNTNQRPGSVGPEFEYWCCGGGCVAAEFLWLYCHTWAAVVTHVVELLIKTPI